METPQSLKPLIAKTQPGYHSNCNMKICVKCKAEKPLLEFYKDRYARDGRTYSCASCLSAIKRFRKENFSRAKKW